MQHINILALGHKLADPIQWVLYLEERFQQPITQEVFHEPDRCLIVEVTNGDYHIATKAPVHALLTKEESYRVLLAQPVDLMIYIQSVFTHAFKAIQRDFTIVNRLLDERPTRFPVFTLLNDIHCGESAEARLTSEELTCYRIPDSRVFRTAISHPAETRGCAYGADEVFDALIDVLDGMKA